MTVNKCFIIQLYNGEARRYVCCTLNVIITLALSLHLDGTVSIVLSRGPKRVALRLKRGVIGAEGEADR